MFFVCLMPVIRFSRNVLRAAHICHTFLSKCLACGSYLSCVPVEMSCVRSRLLFAACAPNRTACGMFRSCSAVGRDRHSCVLGCRVVIELGWFTSGLRVSLWRSRRRTKGNAENGGGGAAECVFAQAYRLCGVFRGESVGGCAPPNLRQRAIGSLDSLHLGRDVGALYAAKGTRV